MTIYTTMRQQPFQIDERDLEKVLTKRWYLAKGRPATTMSTNNGNRLLYLHIFLFGKAPDGLQWDHINRDKCDNRRENLRIVTHTVNQRNKGITKSNSTGVNGVARFNGRGQKHFSATIRVNGELIQLGFFLTLEEAAKARQDGEKIYWGSER